MNTETEIIAANVRALRARMALTQDELAGRIGMSRPTLAAVECGRPCKLETISRLAEVFGVSVIDLQTDWMGEARSSAPRGDSASASSIRDTPTTSPPTGGVHQCPTCAPESNHEAQESKSDSPKSREGAA